MGLLSLEFLVRRSSSDVVQQSGGDARRAVGTLTTFVLCCNGFGTTALPMASKVCVAEQLKKKPATVHTQQLKPCRMWDFSQADEPTLDQCVEMNFDSTEHKERERERGVCRGGDPLALLCSALLCFAASVLGLMRACVACRVCVLTTSTALCSGESQLLMALSRSLDFQRRISWIFTVFS